MEEKLNELPPIYKSWWDLYSLCHKKVQNTTHKEIIIQDGKFEFIYRISIDFLKARALEDLLKTPVGFNDLRSASNVIERSNSNYSPKFYNHKSIQELLRKFIRLKTT